MENIVLSSDEVRKLRAKVYGECQDGNWEACKDGWMRPSSVEWLKEKAKFPITNFITQK
jgi:hypothetical protein